MNGDTVPVIRIAAVNVVDAAPDRHHARLTQENSRHVYPALGGDGRVKDAVVVEVVLVGVARRAVRGRHIRLIDEVHGAYGAFVDRAVAVEPAVGGTS